MAGGSLPPRKRLLAGLKKNGWLINGSSPDGPSVSAKLGGDTSSPLKPDGPHALFGAEQSVNALPSLSLDAGDGVKTGSQAETNDQSTTTLVDFRGAGGHGGAEKLVHERHGESTRTMGESSGFAGDGQAGERTNEVRVRYSLAEEDGTTIPELWHNEEYQLTAVKMMRLSMRR